MTQAIVSVLEDLPGRSCYLPDRGVIAEAVGLTPSGQTTVSVDGQQAEDVSEVVVLPRLGESVWIAEGRETPLHGRWIGLRTPLTAPTWQVTARVLCDGAVLEHTGPARVFDARTVRMIAESTPAAPDGDLQAVAQLAAMLDQQAVQHELWRAEFAEAAGHKADEMDLCGQFDDFMHEWHLPGRKRSFTILVDTSQLVSLTVEAETAGDAEELLTTEMVKAARSVDSLSWSVSRTYREQ
ncbi:hypothetical protein GCM10023328_47040 [Modestobacter marinus]|uniref:Uncharacterized protein n=1 Tax=Modestobacter marinus TaxID=477641 RepID=A0ABQ2GD29_9ACTN|nr:hypothetical protein [Modestobacter marinus]GGL86268.1 hypothetical protein GCM10011589_48320 [Modestobacter marinus]